jgi:hypothetical protein
VDLYESPDENLADHPDPVAELRAEAGTTSSRTVPPRGTRQLPTVADALAWMYGSIKCTEGRDLT